MYVPASFAVHDEPTLWAFMEHQGFALIVAPYDEGPSASHLPLLVKRSEGPRGRLWGHMARANSQWRHASGQRVLTVFSGPHAYISPAWYDSPRAVPTWNYLAVHAYGTLTLIDDRDALLSVVSQTVDRYERDRQTPWSLANADNETIERLLDAIVGFRIDIDRVEGQWKLSQNQPIDRRRRIAQELTTRGQPDDLSISDAMLQSLE